MLLQLHSWLKHRRLAHLLTKVSLGAKYAEI
ncbi:hypothetical protein FIV00_04260 [Labrenzia sp. THAF82]|nr:hypothetical protein FIV00_04260 [Labrenzia sp. THAF82]